MGSDGCEALRQGLGGLSKQCGNFLRSLKYLHKGGAMRGAYGARPQLLHDQVGWGLPVAMSGPAAALAQWEGGGGGGGGGELVQGQGVRCRAQLPRAARPALPRHTTTLWSNMNHVWSLCKGEVVGGSNFSQFPAIFRNFPHLFRSFLF